MKDKNKIKTNKIQLRKNRTRKKIAGGSTLPRLSVFRSLKHFYTQIIDDKAGKTVCSASDKEIDKKGKKPIEIAKLVGELIAQKALDNKVEKVVFDRSSYQYHGRVKAAAEGAREKGLKF